jgi:hypothetical protein
MESEDETFYRTFGFLMNAMNCQGSGQSSGFPVVHNKNFMLPRNYMIINMLDPY